MTAEIVEVPDALTLLRHGAALVVSVSGGKDSDAMLYNLVDLRQREGWSGDMQLVHADLGRAEWLHTPAYVENLSERTGIQLNVVQWTGGDLIMRIWARWEKLNHLACPWPSSKARYCTSDLKREPISRWIRNTYPTGDVVCAMGLRAEESGSRAKKAVMEVRESCTAPTKGRLTLNWLPIHNWLLADVWECIRTHGNVFHPAYTFGNQRLSCACCVLASLNDLINGAMHNPDTYRELCRIEAVTGYSFRKGLWLSDVNPALLPGETLAAVARWKITPPEHSGQRPEPSDDVCSTN